MIDGVQYWLYAEKRKSVTRFCWNNDGLNFYFMTYFLGPISTIESAVE